MAVVDVDVRDLDALELGATAPRRRVAGTWAATWPPALALVLVVAVWEALVLAHVKTGLLPSPADVASSLGDEARSGDLWSAVWGSTHRAVLGFLVAALIGTPLGLLLAQVRLLRRMFQPIVSGLQVLPSVAWVPAAIVWFGLTPSTIYAVVLLGAIPSICNATIAGLDQVPPLLTRVGRVLGARGLGLARHVLLPAALPTYVSGLKQGWAFAWRSLMAAELITISPSLGLGLGQLLDRGRELSDESIVIGGVLLILVVGIVVELGLFAPVERRVLRNRGLASR